MVGIYKITSPSGRIYIGQSINIDKRFSGYRSRKSPKQVRLNASFKKHGVYNHLFEVIEECLIEQLNDRERYWQDFYNVLSQTKGLNCRLTKSSDRSGKMSDATIEKIKISKKHTSKETRRKMSESAKGKIPWNIGKTHMAGKDHPLYGKKGVDNPSFGRKNTKETKARMSISASGKNNSSAKKVLNKESGKVYECAKYAANDLGFSVSYFRKMLSGQHKNNTKCAYI